MSESIRPFRRLVYRRAQRGQTLVIAIAVLFVLLFVGTVFVAEVAQNLTATARSRTGQDAQALAEAGIRYCDSELTFSTDGADWRPEPTVPRAANADPTGASDPDYYWLSQGYSRVTFRGGRALVRVSYDPHFNDPRSQLLKIEAVGRPGDLGSINDPTIFVQDQSFMSTRGQRRELIAYKQMGLTDYLRFITNKDRREQENFLGVPTFGRDAAAQNANRGVENVVAAVFGDPTIQETLGRQPRDFNANGKDWLGINNGEHLMGAPIRVNGNLTLGGDTFLYENPARPFDGLLVSGKINLRPTRDVNGDGALDGNDHQAWINVQINDDERRFNVASALLSTPTDGTGHETNGGLVRDGSNLSDTVGYNNNIPRLEPPRIDTLTDGSGVNRYRALTRDSGFWQSVNSGKPYNTGQNGWGRGIYINNPKDLQKETTRSGINGGYSLRADWLNPNAQFALGYWQGPYYRPPGVLIELLGDRIRLTRSDDRVFLKPDGTPITYQSGKVIEIPLSDLERQNYVLPDGTAFALAPLDHAGDDPGTYSSDASIPPYDKNSYGANLVIMAEGNVRVKGAYGVVTNPSDTTQRHLSRVHLTIVSGGTAYIEGNIVKGDGYVDTNGVQHLERASTCAILAKDYVTVNTTMFMSPENQTNVFTRLSPDLDQFYTQLGLSRSGFDASFSFGVPPATYTTTVNNQAQPSPLFLLLRHAALRPGPTYMNLQVNPALRDGTNNPLNDPFYQFEVNGPNTQSFPRIPPAETYIVGMKYPNFNNGASFIPVTDEIGITPGFEMRAFPLNTNPIMNYAPASQKYFTPIRTPGFDNILRFTTDQSAAQQADAYGISLQGASDYLLADAQVTPLDIRIEALLYAQEHSFFVIPGYPINQDNGDTRQAFVNAINNGRPGIRTSYSRQVDDPNNPLNNIPLDSAMEKLAKDIFPFYNEPVDIRITILGSVSENYTASYGDQAAWLARWGYIPAQYGSTQYTNTPVSVPDDHLYVHDPGPDASNPQIPGYIAGEDRANGVDFRTLREKSAVITRGLRFLYDPVLAMPYRHAADFTLDGDPTGKNDTTDPAYRRQQRALRVQIWPQKQDSEGNILRPEFRQILPPMPRLPVCPGLLYFGDSEQQAGVQ